jgi:hypothetical protein
VAFPPPYSVPFIQANAYVGGGLSFEVPAEFVAVIRDYSLYTAAGGSDSQLIIQGAGALFGIVVASLSAVGVNVTEQWEGRVVAGSGYTISVTSGGLSVNDCIYVGGYLLRA